MEVIHPLKRARKKISLNELITYEQAVFALFKFSIRPLKD